MKALPQRPGPGGSRVIKKRPSIPRLGDGLISIFAHEDTVAHSTVYVAQATTEVSSTLTSNNLDHFAKSSNHHEETASVCTPHESITSSLFSPSCSRYGTPRGDETPPTTLTGGNSPYSSDEETTVELSPPTPMDDKTSTSTETTPSPTYGWEDTSRAEPLMAEIKSTSRRVSISSLRTEKRALRQDHDVPHLAQVETVKVPEVESLRSIVEGFFKVKSSSPSVVKDQDSSIVTPKPLKEQRPFWDLNTIVDFYLKGAITLEKAKETARRHGFPDAIKVIDHHEAQKKVEPVTVDLATQRPIKLKKVLPPSSALDTYKQKLGSYRAEDIYTGSARPLHIFVDMSNIFIGFCDSWKISQNIPVHQFIRAPAFNFKVLTSIMQRSRPVTKKILAGSVSTAVSGPAQWPRYFIEAQEQGYRMNILNRVQKHSPVRGRRKNKAQQGTRIVCSTDLLTSGDESTEDHARASFETRNGEQGVDEILHLNMMDSVIDCIGKPASMILATGDAAQAEFSDGFLQYATRALDRGWRLELVTWKKTLSSAWTNPGFRNQYEDRFRIIYLDDFIDELNADLCPSLE